MTAAHVRARVCGQLAQGEGCCAVQREVDVDVAVARVRHVTLRRDQRVIASVAGPVEHDQLVGR